MPGVYGVSGQQGELAQMDSGLILGRSVNSTGKDAGHSHVLYSQKDAWTIHFAPDGQVLDVTKN